MATLEQINRAERVLMDRVDALRRTGPHGMKILPGLGVMFAEAAQKLRKRIREGNYDGVDARS